MDGDAGGTKPRIPGELRSRTEAIGDQLRAKIASKFQTSVFLAGFAATILSIQMSLLWQSDRRPGLLPVSIAVLVGALALYIAAIIALDGLTMPKRFWDEDTSRHDVEAAQLAYLEQEDLWELQKRMVFFWYKLTMVATALVAVSLVGLLLPYQPVANAGLYPDITALCAGVATLSACVYLLVVRTMTRKRFSPLLRPCD